MNEASRLPLGWTIAGINDTGRYINGFAFKPSHWGEVGRPIIRIQNLTDEEKVFNRTTFEVDDDLIVHPGEILVSWSATLDAFIWKRETAVLNQHIFRVVPEIRVVHPTFLFYLLRWSIWEMKETEHLHGSTMKHINRGPFLAHTIKLPPLLEQSRIVAEIEKQFTRLDAAVAALRRVQANLKRYRAAVLKAACEGRLVPTEAELACKQGRTYETGEQLLARILKERRTKWEADQLAKMLAAGKAPKDDDWKKKYKEPKPPDTSNVPPLPEGWTWANLDQLKMFSIYGPRFSSDDYSESGTIVLRTTDISESGKVDLDSAPRLDLATSDVAKYRLIRGDLVFTRTGATIGKTAIFDDDVQAIPGAYLIHFRLATEASTGWYLYRFFQSVSGQRWLLAGRLGIGQPNLNAPTIEAIPIPLPPVPEQQRILGAIDAQLTVVEKESSQVTESWRKGERLRPSLLKRAFQGKLVPQDPNDEPASALLERIRAERAKKVQPPKRTSQTRRRRSAVAEAL